MTSSATTLIALCVPLLMSGAAAPEPERGAQQREEADEGDTVEIVVETKKRPDWLFPPLDHPRVQAFFNSSNNVGPSLFDKQGEAARRPLVRAGTIAVRGAGTRAQRKAARRFARALVERARPALEACYKDALAREASDATRLTLRVSLDGRDRSAVRLASGVLGDVYGNACVHGVLEFVDLDVPAVVADVDIPVWFWLQSY